jgi:cytochrome bd ubiquinol oxidase subunit I
LAIPLTIAALASPVQVLVGDWSAQEVARMQPVKLAAFEGLFHTERGAPEHILGWYTGGRVIDSIEIPKLLSLLSFHDPNHVVDGLDSVSPHKRPPVNGARVAFQLMVGIGFFLAGLAAVQLYVRMRHGRLPESRVFYLSVVAAGPLALAALLAGWIPRNSGASPGWCTA